MLGLRFSPLCTRPRSNACVSRTFVKGKKKEQRQRQRQRNRNKKERKIDRGIVGEPERRVYSQSQNYSNTFKNWISFFLLLMNEAKCTLTLLVSMDIWKLINLIKYTDKYVENLSGYQKRLKRFNIRISMSLRSISLRRILVHYSSNEIQKVRMFSFFFLCIFSFYIYIQ